MQTSSVMSPTGILCKPDRAIVITLAVVAAVLIGGYWLTRHSDTSDVPPYLRGSLWPEPRSLVAFTLLDQHGREFDLDRLQGRWTFMVFGYASCPDVCPTTLAVLNQVAAQLGTDGAGDIAQFVFVSVDPEHDAPRQLGRYLGFFNRKFVGLTGQPDEVAGLARQLNVMYQRVERASGQYFFTHTSSVMLIDPRARLHAAFSEPLTAEMMVDKFRIIQRRYEEQP